MTIPTSLAEIVERQNIILIMKANWNNFTHLSYHKGELEEVFTFCEERISNQRLFEKSNLKVRFKGLFSNKGQEVLKGKITQMILLLQKIYQHYFARIRIKDFPDSFKIKLGNAINMLQSLDLNKYDSLIRENRFRLSHCIDFANILSFSSVNEQLQKFWDTFFLFEAYHSITYTVLKQGFNFPIYTEKDIYIEGLYHPLLANPVKNNLVICKKVSLITGPNMAGKSTLLKSLALCIYLGHLGLPVPASICKMPFFDAIFVFSNSTDNVKSGYSHFMTELKNLKKVLQNASAQKKVFAIFDEMFKSTNVDDALELLSQTLVGLNKYSNSYFFISTHLSQLNSGDLKQSDHIEYYFVECEIINNKVDFRYTLEKGFSNLKIGKLLFESEGLSDLL